MKEYLVLLKRTSLLKLVKSILYYLPMILLSEKLYHNLHGEYKIAFTQEAIIQFVTSSEGIKSIILFGVIFTLSYLLEQEILPPILGLFYGRTYNNKKFLEQLSFIERRIKALFKQKTLSPFLNAEMRFEIYYDISFMTITVTLWMVYINTWWSYCIIAFTCITSISLVKALNTFMAEFQSNLLERVSNDSPVE